MLEPLQLQTAAWVITTALELALFVQLIRHHVSRDYPQFVAYLVSAILQSLALAALYRTENLDKLTAWNIAWTTQGLVVLMRAFVLVELNRKVLSRFIGIWALARRLLVGVAAAVIAYDLLLSKGQWQWLILNGVRGLELAMAAVIVTMLLFARFYRVPVNQLQRALAVGLCLYSTFYVINYSFLERIVQQYSVLWNFLGLFAFIASLLIWINATIRCSDPTKTVALPAMPPELYGKLSSEVNSRLLLLNRQLIQFMHVEDRSQ